MNVILKSVLLNGQSVNVTPIQNGPRTAERLLSLGFDAVNYLVNGQRQKYVYAYRETKTGRVVFSL